MTGERSYLVVGGDSMIGTAVAGSLRHAGASVTTTTRRAERSAGSIHLDLAAAPSTWPSLPQADVTFICAGETSLDHCRRRPDETRVVNVSSAVEIARRARAPRGVVVFFSTNLVFDGMYPNAPADAKHAPHTEYGRQKSEAETMLGEEGRTLVVRMTKVLGPESTLFRRWVGDLDLGRVIEVYQDAVLAPVSLALVTRGVSHACELGLEGVLQFSAARDITYADAACAIAQRRGVSPDRVRTVKVPHTDHEFFPRYTSLDAARASRELGITPPDPFDTLERLDGERARVKPRRGA